MSFLIRYKKINTPIVFFAKKMEGVYTLPVLAILEFYAIL